MPLFYQDVAHILSFRQKSEILAYPRYPGVDWPSETLLYLYDDKAVSSITDAESKHCFEIFMQQCKEARCSLMLSLLKLNETNSYDLHERNHLEGLYNNELILMSGIVQEKRDIERVITKWFPNDSWDSGQEHCKYLLNNALTLSEAIKERCSLYNRKKSELAPRCEKCSGGPCINGDFGANNVTVKANLEKTGGNCLLEHAYLDCVKEIHDLMKLQDSYRNFNWYLTWKSGLGRRALHSRAFGGPRGYYTVEEAVEVSLREQIRNGVSQLRSRAENWIISKSPKQGGMKMPLWGAPPRFIFFSIFAAFTGFKIGSHM